MIIAATLTPHAIVADTHQLVIGADTLRGGFVEDIGETVERYRHGLDDAGKIEEGIAGDILLGSVVERGGDHRDILDPIF
jgi:hypothetical protein